MVSFCAQRRCRAFDSVKTELPSHPLMIPFSRAGNAPSFHKWLITNGIGHPKIKGGPHMCRRFFCCRKTETGLSGPVDPRKSSLATPLFSLPKPFLAWRFLEPLRTWWERSSTIFASPQCLNLRLKPPLPKYLIPWRSSVSTGDRSTLTSKVVARPALYSPPMLKPLQKFNMAL